MNTKEYLEKRNDLVDKMDKIVNTAKSEDRAVTEEEKENFTKYENEVKAIDSTLEMEEKMNKIDVKEVVDNKALSQEEKDNKAFLNIIKRLQNEDTPVIPGDNGVLIPQTVANRIISKIQDVCPIFEMAERYNVIGTLLIPVETSDTITMSYADEFTDAESGKVVVGSVRLGGYLARCLVKVSKSLINNSNFDVVGYVIDKIAYKASKFIEDELINGTEDKIEGLTGIAQDMTMETATANKVGADDLIDLQDKIVEPYQANSIFIMTRATRNAIRKLKDGEGNYLLNRDFEAKWGYRLLGKDVYTTDAITDGSVIYGDLTGLAVKVSENVSIQVLNERYAVEHATGLLAFIEMDAKVQNTQKLAKLTVKGTVVSA